MPVRRKRPVESVRALRVPIVSAACARGSPFRRSICPASAVIPRGALSGGKRCHFEQGLPSQGYTLSSSLSSTGDPGRIALAGWKWVVFGAGADTTRTPAPIAVGGLAVLKGTLVKGTRSPVASTAPFTVSV